MPATALIESVLCSALRRKPLPESLPHPLRLLRPKKQQIILHSGFAADTFYILLRGICSVRIYSEQGTDTVAATQSDLQVYGFSERLHDKECHATVYAASDDCELLVCPASLFLQTMEQSLPLALLMVRYLSGTAVGSMQSSAKRAFSSPRLALAEYCYSAALGKPLPHLLTDTREELADSLRLNLRTLYRHLQALKDAGCISVQRGKTLITAENLTKLETFIGAHHTAATHKEKR